MVRMWLQTLQIISSQWRPTLSGPNGRGALRPGTGGRAFYPQKSAGVFVLRLFGGFVPPPPSPSANQWAPKQRKKVPWEVIKRKKTQTNATRRKKTQTVFFFVLVKNKTPTIFHCASLSFLRRNTVYSQFPAGGIRIVPKFVETDLIIREQEIA